MSGPAFAGWMFACGLICGLSGLALGYLSGFASAHIASHKLPPECTYLRGGVSICLFPSEFTKVRKREIDRARRN